MLKKVLITISVLLNVFVLLALCIYFFTSSLDLLMYQGATMKFFDGDHENAAELKEQNRLGLECLEDSGYFDEEDEDEPADEVESTEGFTLIEEGDMGNTYEGTATVSGTYTYYAENAHGIPFMVFPTEADLELLPGNGTRFAVSNYEEILEILMDGEVETCGTYTGSISLEIDGYNELTAEIGASDTTTFVKVKSWSMPTCE